MADRHAGVMVYQAGMRHWYARERLRWRVYVISQALIMSLSSQVGMLDMADMPGHYSNN